MKQAVLFKAPTITVQETAGPVDGVATEAKAMLKTEHRSILLDGAAAEVLIGYLRVVRAYYSCVGRQKRSMHLLFEQVAAQLEQKLQMRGRGVADQGDITQLIQRLGCMHDWATKLHTQ